MAVDTGGVALLNTNDFQGGLSRIYQQVSTYYTLGVTLSKLGIAGYQKVEVIGESPGDDGPRAQGVRAAVGDPARREPRARDDGDGPPYNAIPAKIETAPATPGQEVLPASRSPCSCRRPSLTFVPDGDKETATRRVLHRLGGRQGRQSDLNRQETTFQLPAGQAERRSARAVCRAAPDQEGQLPDRRQRARRRQRKDGHGANERARSSSSAGSSRPTRPSRPVIPSEARDP